MYIIAIKNTKKNVTKNIMQFYAGSEYLTDDATYAKAYNSTEEALTEWTYKCRETLPDLQRQKYTIYITERPNSEERN